MALMTDISVIGRDTKIGMPATRFLGPALGSLHMFFHRLGPASTRRPSTTSSSPNRITVEAISRATRPMRPACRTFPASR
jgi:enoyl-CoA hydratase